MSLTDEQKFLFDLQGFLVIPQVLSAEECARYIALVDEKWPRTAADPAFRRFQGIHQFGQPFVDLMDHSKVLPYLVELIGRKLRVDHDYCIFMQASSQAMGLHGGPRLFETDHWYYYQDGVMRNGLMVATFNLTDAPEGAGGFACIPGSHKSNFLRNVPADVASFERRPEYVVQPALQAGDVLIFTEALIHGTSPWQAAHERKTLLYKYSPPHSSWALANYNLSDFPEATDRQRRLMQPASVEGHQRVVEKGEL